MRFLRQHHHKGEVPLVTVDIGANDVDGCGSVPPSDVAACVTSGLGTINNNLPKIYAGLKKAAPKGTTFAAMTLYDPFLAGYFAPAGSTNNTLEPESIALAKVLNGDLTTNDSHAGFLTADVAAPLTPTTAPVWSPGRTSRSRSTSPVCVPGPGPARRPPAAPTSMPTRTATR